MNTLAQQQEAEIWCLYDFGSVLSEKGLGAYLSEFLVEVVRLFECDGASIFLFDAGDQRFYLAEKSGDLAHIPHDASFRFGDGIAGKAAKAGLPMLVDDPSKHHLLKIDPSQVRQDIGSAIVIPLVSLNGTCEGILNLSRRATRAAFSMNDLEHARKMASQLSLAIANARLIAELSASMEQTRSMHERLQAAVDGATFSLFVFSASGRLELWNNAATQLAGGPLHSEMDWDHVRAVLPIEFREPLLSLETCTDKESSWRRLQNKGGDQSWTLCATRLSDESTVVTAQDVSEVEKLRQEESKLKRLAEIGQMSAAIAHDIRNPLTGIVAAASMILDTSPSASEFALIIKDEARKLNVLCDDFLDFAKPIVLHKKPALLNSVVESSCAALQHQFSKAGISLTIENSSNGEPVDVDPIRLALAVQNLLLNALQASVKGSEVTISVRDKSIEIQDQGSGIPADQLENLFTPFYTTKPKGTGLGLCNVKKIVDANGGTIRVESTLGVGTRIQILLSHGE